MRRASSLGLELSAQQARLFASITGIACVVLDPRGGIVEIAGSEGYPCRLCVTTKEHGQRGGHDGTRHLARVDEASRFGGQSIFLCENAFTHWAAPVYRDGMLVAALVAGPVLTIEEESFFEQEISARNRELPAEQQSALATWFDGIPKVEPSAVRDYADLLTQLALAVSAAGNEPSAQSPLAQQSRMNEYIQELKVARSRAGHHPDEPTYPVDLELQLLDNIRDGSASEAQATLNRLLSHVFFASGSKMEEIAMRAKELVVLLSRTVVREGADPQEVFGLNYQFAASIDHQEDINGVAYWMARIVRRFADLVLYLPHLTHARALKKAREYIRERVPARVRLEDVARVAGLSPTHLSRVFKREMGVGVSEYVNQIRCERASDLLTRGEMNAAEVAEACGFSDHSYFTRVFKKVTGKTPSEVLRGETTP